MEHSITFIARWGDMDSNNHMRHSAYNDYGAHARYQFFTEHGFTGKWFQEQNIVPILFREETKFLKEISVAESIKVDVRIQNLTTDGAKWTFTHRFIKDDGTLAATISVDGAWMNYKERKVCVPTGDLKQHVEQLERTEDFKLIERNK